ncbi:putative ATP-dependent endonuclease of OLD family [Paenibacillus sp. V4I9]|uniref:ATP-dependent nuclease n=1 Tax=Paenibacillus sp. V4I9 TaxID=3042308 RepID=UPI00277F54E3|nr:AAA family ATPase [Paenibacillus sp. V4I9]MDQ0885935.1 putative ATP-dependent endonuclease of OLD family [Paenibacillus sp. V4I9]
MKIEKIIVKNYKSIVDSKELNFHENFNVLAGKNNSGKTAFIEAVFKSFQGVLDMPNSGNDQTASNRINQIDPSIIELTFSFNIEEDMLMALGRNYGIKKCELILKCWKGNTAILALNQLFDDNNKRIIVDWNDANGNYKYLTIEGQMQAGNTPPNYMHHLFNNIAKTIIYISGARTVPVQSQISTSMQLDTSATNLHIFMQTLHNNSEEVFDIIQERFKTIFTDINLIRTPINGTMTNLQLSFTGLDSPVSLHECGSGFTHVLIMLCVLYSEQNKVVLFDEPHVYLHPSAEKAIYDLAVEHESHQFILTTHSPILINYPVTKNLFLTSKENGKTSYTQMDGMQEIFKEIGISNSDFALADKVLFVEGETEEAVLPLILRHYGMKQIGYNYKIINLKGTGSEFKNKGAMANNSQKLDMIFKGIAVDPIPYRIIIDRDERDEQKINELREKYGDKILVMGRRELENYFLDNNEALLNILNGYGIEESIDEIESFLADCFESQDRYFYPKERNVLVNDIVGSKVLAKLFEKYGLVYSKVRHGKQIVQWVLDHEPNQLKDVADLVRPFLSY